MPHSGGLCSSDDQLRSGTLQRLERWWNARPQCLDDLLSSAGLANRSPIDDMLGPARSNLLQIHVGVLRNDVVKRAAMVRRMRELKPSAEREAYARARQRDRAIGPEHAVGGEFDKCRPDGSLAHRAHSLDPQPARPGFARRGRRGARSGRATLAAAVSGRICHAGRTMRRACCANASGR